VTVVHEILTNGQLLIETWTLKHDADSTTHLVCMAFHCPNPKYRRLRRGRRNSVARFEQDHADEVRRRIGVVFQSPSLDKKLTVRENLMHHGHLYGLRGPELRRRISEMMERLVVADRADDIVEPCRAGFSGG